MTDTQLSIAIMAHPDRAVTVGDLQAELENQIEAASEPVLGPTIAWDDTGSGVYVTAKVAWSMAVGRHHLVLQDDVELAPDFVEAALRISHHWPHRPVTFFSHDSNVEAACARGARYYEGAQFDGAQALMMPGEMAEEMLRHLDERYYEPMYSRLEDDVVLNRYFHEHKIQVVTTVPSLVDHRTDLESLLGHTPLRARVFAEGSALEYDWNPNG